MDWSQDNLNKTISTNQMIKNADVPVKNGDFPASHGDTFRGVNRKHINVQTLRVKSMALKQRISDLGTRSISLLGRVTPFNDDS